MRVRVTGISAPPSVFSDRSDILFSEQLRLTCSVIILSRFIIVLIELSGAEVISQFLIDIIIFVRIKIQGNDDEDRPAFVP